MRPCVPSGFTCTGEQGWGLRAPWHLVLWGDNQGAPSLGEETGAGAGWPCCGCCHLPALFVVVLNLLLCFVSVLPCPCRAQK